MLRAATSVGVPKLLAASAVAVSHTGNTNETTLATITIPAGAMGLNGAVEVNTVWTVTNSANNKTVIVRLGGGAGTQFLAAVMTTSASARVNRTIRNRGAANSQIGSFPATGINSSGASTGALPTGAIDTSAEQTIVIAGQLASAGETITLEMYEVWLLP